METGHLPSDPAANEDGKGVSPVGRFVNPGILLFVDQLLVAAGGWAFWLVISKLVTTSEIGQATAVISLVALVGGLTQLGIEYPLLKKTAANRTQILGSAFIIELLISLASLPLMFYVLGTMSQSPEWSFWIAGSMFIASSVGFVSRFVLLGNSDAKSILIIDSVGTIIKFTLGYLMIIYGLAASGILISFLCQTLFVAGASIAIARKGINVNLFNGTVAKEIIIEGLANTPFKLARTLVFSLSIVLLAIFGTTSSDIGVFYIALMISILAGSFASNLAFMVIPASSISKSDLSSSSLRLGISLTSPIISLLVSSPAMILGLIGAEYISATAMLQILALSILPFSIAVNSIAKFNNTGNTRRIILTGSIQMLVFLVLFFMTVPQYGTLGASLSILMAFIASAGIAGRWLEKTSFRYIASSCLSILAGVTIGQSIGIVAANQQLLVPLISVSVTSTTLILLKNTTIRELKQLFKAFVAAT